MEFGFMCSVVLLVLGSPAVLGPYSDTSNYKVLANLIGQYRPEMAHWRPDEPALDCQLVVCKIFVLFYNEATA